jgi:PIN domain nuclease of toxin-antitoxin system
MVLDTHIWIWWMNQAAELPQEAFRLLDELDPKPLLADISLWEVAMLVGKGRIQLRTPLLDWLNSATQAVTVVPISPAIAERVASLPESFHGDPADRLVVATALDRGVPLVTRDKKIRKSGLVDLMELAGCG